LEQLQRQNRSNKGRGAAYKRKEQEREGFSIAVQRELITTKGRDERAQVTAVPTRAGWLYLAVLLDLYSRRVIGWP